jgi:hypothetical protein
MENILLNNWNSKKNDILINIEFDLKSILFNNIKSNDFSLDMNINVKEIWEIVFGNLDEYNKIFNEQFIKNRDEWISDYFRNLTNNERKYLIDKYLMNAYAYYDELLECKIDEYIYMKKFMIDLYLSVELVEYICKKIILYIIHEK